MTRTVLIVSPYFPPSTLAGVHRARHLCKHLPDHGWRPIVIRAHERCYTEPGDPGLAGLLPLRLKQVRTGALPAGLCRLAGVGDIGLRAWPYLHRAVARAIVREQPGAVLITGSPFYPMLLARGVARRFRLPVVLDFQDPWVSAQGATRPLRSKEGLSHALANRLEPMALRHAAFVTSVSDIQNQQMAARYPWFDSSSMAAIPIGGDPDDFAALRAPPIGTSRLDPTKINLSYVGTFLPRAGPLVEALFAAVAELRREAPELAARLRLNFIGTSNQPNAGGAHRVRPYAEVAGVTDLVSETPERVPYLEALSVLANSDALLLIGSDEPHYTASKIYPALLSGRPWLSLFHRASSAHALLSAAGGGRAITFTGVDELKKSIPALAQAVRALMIEPRSFGGPDASAMAPFTASAVAGRFAKVFDEVARP